MNRRNLLITMFFFVIAFLILGQLSLAQEWTQWRGPDRDGAIADFSVPAVWPESLSLKWKVPIGEGYSSPVVADGRVYMFARQNGEEVVVCLSLDNGDTLWSKSYPASFNISSAARGHGEGPKSTPVLYKDRLYTFGIGGILSCFDAKTGNLKWREDFSGEFAKTAPIYGTAMSPVIESDMLVANVGGENKGALAAFDMETGKIKWRWDGDGPGYASPIVVEIDGIRQIITQTQKYCVGLSADKGELLWSIPFTTAYDQNIVTPVIYKQMIIFSGIGKGTTAFRITKQGNDWKTEQVWHNEDISMYMSSPVVSGDLLFGLTPKGSGRFFCLDARNGKTLWTSDGRQGENAAILRGAGLLFALTDNAQLIVFKDSAEKFEPVAQYKVADSPTWAHPAILGGRILVKDAPNLSLLIVE